MRPLSRPLEQRTHIHGAIDIPAGIGIGIVAPEAGELYGFFAIRGGEVPRSIEESFSRVPNIPFDIRNHYYWYDIYGGVLVLKAASHTHIFTHSYIAQLMRRKPTCDVQWKPAESPADERWPVLGFHTFMTPLQVGPGELIGHVGNAGFSTGPHIHWEIHHGSAWNKWADRVNPEEWIDE